MICEAVTHVAYAEFIDIVWLQFGKSLAGPRRQTFRFCLKSVSHNT